MTSMSEGSSSEWQGRVAARAHPSSADAMLLGDRPVPRSVVTPTTAHHEWILCLCGC